MIYSTNPKCCLGFIPQEIVHQYFTRYLSCHQLPTRWNTCQVAQFSLLGWKYGKEILWTCTLHSEAIAALRICSSALLPTDQGGCRASAYSLRAVQANRNRPSQGRVDVRAAGHGKDDDGEGRCQCYERCIHQCGELPALRRGDTRS